MSERSGIDSRDMSPIQCATREWSPEGKPGEVWQIYIESNDPRLARIEEIRAVLYPDEESRIHVSTDKVSTSGLRLDEARLEAKRRIQTIEQPGYLEALEAAFTDYKDAKAKLERLLP